MDSPNGFLGYNLYYSSGWYYRNTGPAFALRADNTNSMQLYYSANASGGSVATIGIAWTVLANNGYMGIGTTSPTYNLQVNGSFGATTKSFNIEHPTKPNKRLVHGSLEGPEHGVYIRGRSEINIVELPDYWSGLVDEETVTVQLTAIGKYQNLYVEKIENNKVFIKSSSKSKLNYFYTINAERKDVDKLEVEIEE